MVKRSGLLTDTVQLAEHRTEQLYSTRRGRCRRQTLFLSVSRNTRWTDEWCSQIHPSIVRKDPAVHAHLYKIQLHSIPGIILSMQGFSVALLSALHQNLTAKRL